MLSWGSHKVPVGVGYIEGKGIQQKRVQFGTLKIPCKTHARHPVLDNDIQSCDHENTNMSEVMLGFNHLGPHGYPQYGQNDDGTDHNYFYDGNDYDDNVMIIATGQKVIVDMII